MIKSIGLLQRKEGMTHEQFVDYWERVHAQMAKTCPQLKRYHLNFVVSEPPARPDIPALDLRGQVDGIAELWFDDEKGYAEFRAAATTKTWNADTPVFVGRRYGFLVEEKVIIP